MVHNFIVYIYPLSGYYPLIKNIHRLLSALLFCISILVGGGITLFFMVGKDLPDHIYLKHYEPPVLSRFYTADTQLLHEYALEKRLFVPFHLIPKRLKDAFLAAEDYQFYSHFGIDFLGMGRAIFFNTLNNSWGQNPGGASTITQQVAKNFLVGNERSFQRKAKEAILALRLEYSLPKDRIFELYLNQIYLGSGAYGVAAAALIYFNKELEELTLDEMALLASLPKSPSGLTNTGDLSRLETRRNWVLNRLVITENITQSEADQAKETPLIFKKHKEKPFKADYFTDEVRRILIHSVGEEKIKQGGLTVRTTLDPVLQAHAESSLRKGLIRYDRRHGWRGPLGHLKLSIKDSKEENTWKPFIKNYSHPSGLGEWHIAIVLEVTTDKAKIGLQDGTTGIIPLNTTNWAAPCLSNQTIGDPPKSMIEILKIGDIVPISQNSKAEDGITKLYTLEQIPNVTGGLVVMDPQTGRVLALSGGYDFELNQFNSATQALRQPGSCFKPFVYLVALEQGMTPESKLLDSPISISLGPGRGYYCPQNYNKEYYGISNMRVGLEKSRNVMTVRLAQRVGMNKICQCAKDFGIMEAMPKQIAMVLGAGSTTLLKLVGAYGILANGGIQIKPHLIVWAQDRYGKILYQHELNKNPQRLASDTSLKHLTSMLRGVIERGTARSLQDLGFPVAGKTGTTNNFNDAWFIGYTHDLVVGVFVGFPSPRTLGEGESGGRVSVPIFREFIEAAYQERKKPRFKLGKTKESTVNITKGATEEDVTYLTEGY